MLKYLTVAGVAADLIRKEGSPQRSGTVHSYISAESVGCGTGTASTVSRSLATESRACTREGVRRYKLWI